MAIMSVPRATKLSEMPIIRALRRFWERAVMPASLPQEPSGQLSRTGAPPTTTSSVRPVNRVQESCGR